MSNAVFLRPDENGEWGQIGIDPTSNVSQELVFQDGATAIGNGTVVDVSGYNSLMATLTSTGSAVIQFEYSMDDVSWVSLPGQIIQNTGANISLNTSLTITSTTFIRFNIVGLKYVRFRISTYTSGVIGVSAVGSTGSVQYSSGASLAFGNIDTNAANNTLLGVGAYNLLFDGTSWTRQRTVSQVGDGVTGTGSSSAGLVAFNGTTWDRVRVGKVYKYIEYLNLPTSTTTTVWTPAGGKKFRLMGVSISTSASVHLHLRDSGTIFHTVRPLATTVTFEFGNGYLSAVVGNVLEIRNDSGTTTNVWVTAWGTEE